MNFKEYTKEEFLVEHSESGCPAGFNLVNYCGSNCDKCWERAVEHIKFKGESEPKLCIELVGGEELLLDADFYYTDNGVFTFYKKAEHEGMRHTKIATMPHHNVVIVRHRIN
ncbi:hypothetical protein [Metaclostridioides mangenotii]|uniref:hypothetical protein n=1 Tax=Metaclostridioides mangenotii TaxID=1540 RepID=UPI0028E8F00A|nr:hypothetical protein [Clostridioides mangenotii]